MNVILVSDDREQDCILQLIISKTLRAAHSAIYSIAEAGSEPIGYYTRHY